MVVSEGSIQHRIAVPGLKNFQVSNPLGLLSRFLTSVHFFKLYPYTAPFNSADAVQNEIVRGVRRVWESSGIAPELPPDARQEPSTETLLSPLAQTEDACEPTQLQSATVPTDEARLTIPTWRALRELIVQDARRTSHISICW